MKFTEQLLETPLMQGMNRADLDEVVAQTKFGFMKVAQGQEVVVEDSACTHLYLLFSGTLSVESYADDRSYCIIEEMTATELLCPFQEFDPGIEIERPEQEIDYDQEIDFREI